MSLTDADYMARALTIARRGAGRTAPNPLVGAVVVSREGVIVGSGHHERAGGAHAEVVALAAAGEGARGATLYCTLEPCCHQGRTGPCVDRIVDAGIARVVAAMQDPDPRVSGGGVGFLESHGVSVTVGVGAREAEDLNRAFATTVTDRRPFVILKAATSLDGRIAASPGVRTRITSAAADRLVQMTRAEVDAIVVGSGTMLADDPLLTVRDVHRVRPLVRAIFDRRLRTPPGARIFDSLDAGPVLILTAPEQIRGAAAARLAARGAIVRAFDSGDVASGFRALRDFDVSAVLLEGGAGLHAAAWDAGIVDAVHLYVAPMTLGPNGVPLLDGRRFAITDLENLQTFPCGPDTVFRGYVHRTR